MIVVNQSIGELTNDIINDFANNHEEVTVFTGNDTEFLTSVNNVKYFYGTNYNKKNNLTRLLSWFYFSIQYLKYHPHAFACF